MLLISNLLNSTYDNLLQTTTVQMASNVTRESPSTICKKCSKLFTDPRMLPCLHSFCKKCIESLVTQDGSKKTIRCPSCKAATPIPEKGVEAIPQNVRLSYEAEVALYEAKIKGQPPSECDECCRVPPQPIVAFCYMCRGFLCKPCHEHHCVSRQAVKHKVLKIEEARNKEIAEELKQHIPPPPLYCQEHAGKEVEFYCTSCNVLMCMKCTIIDHTGHKFEDLTRYAQKWKEDLSQSAQSMPDTITKLDAAIANGKVMTRKVGARRISVNDAIRNTFQELCKALDEREKALLAQSSEIVTTKLTSLQIQMEEMMSLRDEISSCSAAISEAQRSHTDAQLLSVVTVLHARLQEVMNKFSVMALQLREDDTMTIAVETTALVSDISTFGSIKKRQPRDYTRLSKPVMTISGINTPYYVAVHYSGDVFVTSHNNHCVCVFDKNGTKKATIGSRGSGDGQFSYPLGIAISGDVMFVAENGGNRIQKLTITGEPLMKFGTSGMGNGQLHQPRGICLAGDGKLYVAEYANKRVQVFNPDGTFSSIITGLGDNELRKPKAVAIDQSGNLHVADHGSNCIKVFTADGEYIRQYGSGQLLGPTGIIVDQDGYCLVGDQSGNCLWIFDPDGKFVHSVPTTGSLRGVTLDNEGFMYVVDSIICCVHKF